MSEPDTLEKIEPIPVPAKAGRKLPWRWQWLIAPLMGISLLLHVALLFVPLPEPDIAEEENIEEELPPEEEAVDILSLSDIPVPEPPPEPPAQEPPPAEPAPAPAAAAPVPDPDQIPDNLPEPDPAAEPDPELDPELEPEPDPQPQFDPAVQSDLFNRSGNIGGNPRGASFDLTGDFLKFAWDSKGEGIQTWPQEQRNCFFAAIDASNYTLAAGVNKLKFLARNAGEVVTEDLPVTFSTENLAEDPNGYCGGRFFEVQNANGPTGVWVSVLEPSGGTALVLLWESDPRAS